MLTEKEPVVLDQPVKIVNVKKTGGLVSLFFYAKNDWPRDCLQNCVHRNSFERATSKQNIKQENDKVLLVYTRRLAKSETYLQNSHIGILRMLNDIKNGICP